MSSDKQKLEKLMKAFDKHLDEKNCQHDFMDVVKEAEAY